MKGILISLLSFVLSAAVVNHVNAQSGMFGSKHDFSAQQWAGTTEVCAVCHTPHNAKDGMGVQWRREVTDANGYDSALRTAYNTTWGIPDGPTLLCLSCHDGTLGLENFGAGGLPIQEVAPLKRTGDGTTLAAEHPVSIDYNTSLIPSELNDEASVRASGLVLYGPSGSGRVQCSTCHDVHNNNVVAGTMLLREAKAGSTICLVCHKK